MLKPQFITSWSLIEQTVACRLKAKQNQSRGYNYRRLYQWWNIYMGYLQKQLLLALNLELIN